MGSFSLWHWLVLVLIVFVPAMLIGLAIWLAVRLSRRRAHRLERQPGGRPVPGEVPEQATGYDACRISRSRAWSAARSTR